MCVTMIATLHSGKTNTSRDPYIHSQGSFINQTAVHLSTHSIFFPTWDYKVVRLCQESSRCSAKGVRAMCVRKKARIRDFGVKREGMGRRGEMGLEAERPEMERETEEQWETDLLQDSCSLSGACSQHICSPLFFFALVIIWSRGIRNRPGVSV